MASKPSDPVAYETAINVMRAAGMSERSKIDRGVHVLAEICKALAAAEAKGRREAFAEARDCLELLKVMGAATPGGRTRTVGLLVEELVRQRNHFAAKAKMEAEGITEEDIAESMDFQGSDDERTEAG